jgi:ABC-2 type transport system ATP-binding protein
MNNLLKLHSLKKYFATQKAVDDISFEIKQGDIFGLLGPNGAGKTTLLRMITGIFYPDSGQILFDGKPFDPINHANQIGYMPEERGLYKKMKIGEQVLYLARLKGMSRADAMEEIKKWFIKLEMESWWNKKVEDLSKGMSQKMQFVTTVVHRPKLIILDEPFSGLDPVNANLIKDEIFALANNGSTILFSTHRMEQVEEICNQIVLVNQGKKILDGTVREVKQQFKKNIYRLGAAIPSSFHSDGFFEIISQHADEIMLKLSPQQTPNAVLAHCIQQGIPIQSFNEVLPSLNDIFLQLVEESGATRKFQTI